MAKQQICGAGHFYDVAEPNCPICRSGPKPAGPTVRHTTAAAPPPGHAAGVEAAPPRGTVGVQPRDGKTVVKWEFGARGDSARAEPGQARRAILPTCGWLACIEGDDFGQDFRIKPEGNHIARGIVDGIALTDPHVTRDPVAEVFYDPLDNTFTLNRVGKAGVRVNGTAVHQPHRLEAHDIIEIGKTKLVFIPLCGDRFSWVIGP